MRMSQVDSQNIRDANASAYPWTLKSLRRQIGKQSLLEFYLNNGPSLIRTFPFSSRGGYAWLCLEFCMYTLITIDTDTLREILPKDRSISLLEYFAVISRDNETDNWAQVRCEAIVYMSLVYNAAIIFYPLILYLNFCNRVYSFRKSRFLSFAMTFYTPQVYIPIMYSSLASRLPIAYPNIVFSVIIGIFRAIHSNKYSFEENEDTLASRQSIQSVLIRTLLIMGSTLIPFTLRRNEVFSVFGFIVSAIGIYDYETARPFLRESMNRLYIQLNFLVFGFALAILVSIYSDASKVSLILIMSILVVFAFKAGAAYDDRKIAAFQDIFAGRLEQIQFNQHEFLLDLFVRSKFTENVSRRVKSPPADSFNTMLREGLVAEHARTCIKSTTQTSCSCQTVHSEKESEKQIELEGCERVRTSIVENEILAQYKRYESLTKGVTYNHIAHIYFVCDRVKNLLLVYKQIFELIHEKKSELSLGIRADLRLLLNTIDARVSMQRSQKKLNIHAVFDVDERMFELSKLSIKCFELKLSAFFEISNEQLDLVKLSKSISEFNKQRIFLKEGIYNLCSQYQTLNAINVLELVYRNTIAFDSSLSSRAESLAAAAERRMQVEEYSGAHAKYGMHAKSREGATNVVGKGGFKLESKYRMSRFQSQYSDVFAENSTAVFVSLLQKSFGQIKKVSKSFERIFNRSPRSALGFNCSILMPNCVGSIHNSIVRKYIASGSFVSSNRVSVEPLLAIDKAGYVFPTKIAFEIFISKSQDLGLMSLVSVTNYNRNFMLLNLKKNNALNLHVEACSENLFAQLFSLYFTDYPAFLACSIWKTFPVMASQISRAKELTHKKNPSEQYLKASKGCSSSAAAAAANIYLEQIQQTSCLETVIFMPKYQTSADTHSNVHSPISPIPHSHQYSLLHGLQEKSYSSKENTLYSVSYSLKFHESEFVDYTIIEILSVKSISSPQEFIGSESERQFLEAVQYECATGNTASTGGRFSVDRLRSLLDISSLGGFEDAKHLAGSQSLVATASAGGIAGVRKQSIRRDSIFSLQQPSNVPTATAAVAGKSGTTTKRSAFEQSGFSANGGTTTSAEKSVNRQFNKTDLPLFVNRDDAELSQFKNDNSVLTLGMGPASPQGWNSSVTLLRPILTPSGAGTNSVVEDAIIANALINIQSSNLNSPSTNRFGGNTLKDNASIAGDPEQSTTRVFIFDEELLQQQQQQQQQLHQQQQQQQQQFVGKSTTLKFSSAQQSSNNVQPWNSYSFGGTTNSNSQRIILHGNEQQQAIITSHNLEKQSQQLMSRNQLSYEKKNSNSHNQGENIFRQESYTGKPQLLKQTTYQQQQQLQKSLMVSGHNRYQDRSQQFQKQQQQEQQKLFHEPARSKKDTQPNAQSLSTSAASSNKQSREYLINAFQAKSNPLYYRVILFLSFVVLIGLMASIGGMFFELRHLFTISQANFKYISWGNDLRVQVSIASRQSSIWRLLDIPTAVYPVISDSSEKAAFRALQDSDLYGAYRGFIGLMCLVYEEPLHLDFQSFLESTSAVLKEFSSDTKYQNRTMPLLQGLWFFSFDMYLFQHPEIVKYKVAEMSLLQNFLTFSGLLGTAQTIQEDAVISLNDSIKLSVLILLLVVSIVCSLFLFMISPTYALTQMHVQKIYSLFATVNSQDIMETHSLILDAVSTVVYNFNSNSNAANSNNILNSTSIGDNSIQQTQQQQESTLNVQNIRKYNDPHLFMKKKSIATTNFLPKFSWPLLCKSVFVYALLIIYPISNYLITNDLLQKHTNNQLLQGTLQTMKATLVSEFSVYSMMSNAQYSSYSAAAQEIYKKRFDLVITRADQAIQNLLSTILTLSNESRYQESQFNAFVFHILNEDMCDPLNEANGFDNDTSSDVVFDYTNCKRLFSGVFRKGLLAGLKSTNDFFKELQIAHLKPEGTQRDNSVKVLFSNLTLPDYDLTVKYMSSTIQVLNVFIKTNSDDFLAYMQLIQMMLVIFQAIILLITTQFGFLRFFHSIITAIQSAKHALTVLSVSQILNNPYIFSFLNHNH